jgi:hypothetical protein
MLDKIAMERVKVLTMGSKNKPHAHSHLPVWVGEFWSNTSKGANTGSIFWASGLSHSPALHY